MVLNWNIEVILDFIASSLLLITTIISYTSPKTKKITSLFYLRLGFFCIGLYLLFDGIAILFIKLVYNKLVNYSFIIANRPLTRFNVLRKFKTLEISFVLNPHLQWIRITSVFDHRSSVNQNTLSHIL